VLFQPREPPVRSHLARSARRDQTYPPRLPAARLPPGGKDCDSVRIRRAEGWFPSPSVAACRGSEVVRSVAGQLRPAAATAGGTDVSRGVTGQRPRGRRPRCRSHAGPSCREPGHTAWWSAGPRARPPLARRAAAPRHPERLCALAGRTQPEFERRTDCIASTRKMGCGGAPAGR